MIQLSQYGYGGWKLEKSLTLTWLTWFDGQSFSLMVIVKAGASSGHVGSRGDGQSK